MIIFLVKNGNIISGIGICKQEYALGLANEELIYYAGMRHAEKYLLYNDFEICCCFFFFKRNMHAHKDSSITFYKIFL